MKKIAGVISFGVLTISIGLILFGCKKYAKDEDKVFGVFFRQIYGTVGMVYEDNYLMNFTVYCFNETAPDTEDLSKWSFDNPNVQIGSMEYNLSYQENDLNVYTLTIGMKVKQDGDFTVHSLNYYSDDGGKRFPFGEIVLCRNTENPVFLAHGCDLYTGTKTATISFSDNNEQDFEIVDLHLGKQDILTYEYEKNVFYETGHELRYSIKIDSSEKDGDVIICAPVFIINAEGENKFFAPYIPISYSKQMSYLDIREYVK